MSKAAIGLRETRTCEQLEFVFALSSLGEDEEDNKVSPDVVVKMMKTTCTLAGF
jgi:hypothetical protein